MTAAAAHLRDLLRPPAPVPGGVESLNLVTF